MSRCPICFASMVEAFRHTVRGSFDASYHSCEKCGYLRAHDPRWLSEAYTNAINDHDCGLVLRNVINARRVACLLYLLGGTDGPCVDAAGGYGMLTRLLRDYGIECYWTDPYCENLLARGFECPPNLGHVKVLTAFEVLEHVPDPHAFVRALDARYQPTLILFSTELFAGPPPGTDWRYYDFTSGQHISFYQASTLATLADRLGFSYRTASGLHAFARRPLPHWKLVAATGPAAHFLLPIARRRLGSLTTSDSDRLARQASLRMTGMRAVGAVERRQ